MFLSLYLDIVYCGENGADQVYGEAVLAPMSFLKRLVSFTR